MQKSGIYSGTAGNYSQASGLYSYFTGSNLAFNSHEGSVTLPDWKCTVRMGHHTPSYTE